MSKQRLEAFTDGVIAILITIMVLELHAPEGASLASLRPVVPTLLSYVLSFIFVGVYWNSHHHLLQAAHHIDGVVLWANLHLLFWLSLVPFATAWMGEHPMDSVPTAAYGALLLMAGIAYTILQARLRSIAGPGSALHRAVPNNGKAIFSTAMNVAAVGLAFVRPWMAQVLYFVGAAIWFIPDSRIERELKG